MIYDLGNSNQADEAFTYLTQLIADKSKVDIKIRRPRRSLPQNAYLHLLLGYFGAHFGYTLEESKELYKRLPGNKQIYQYEKDVGGRPMRFVRSSADLDKDEFTKSIDILRQWSAKLDFPLPTATDQEWLQRIENEIERNQKYL